MLCRVKNWSSFQHYKNRNPPWIKLHVQILNDEEFMDLSPSSKALLMLIWVLAPENDGVVDCSPKALQWRLRWKPALQQRDIDKLLKPGWLIPVDASEMPEIVEPKKREPKPSAADVEIPAELRRLVPPFRPTWEDWLDFRTKVLNKPVSARAAAMQLKKLAKDPAAAVGRIEYSISNDYQGLGPWLDRRPPKKPKTRVGRNDDAKPLKEESLEIS